MQHVVNDSNTIQIDKGAGASAIQMPRFQGTDRPPIAGGKVRNTGAAAADHLPLHRPQQLVIQGWRGCLLTPPASCRWRFPGGASEGGGG